MSNSVFEEHAGKWSREHLFLLKRKEAGTEDFVTGDLAKDKIACGQYSFEYVGLNGVEAPEEPEVTKKTKKG